MNWHLPLDVGDDELLCVVGPTASQKTELAIRLCERFGGEVVGADSVQIYAGFDLGSGKPTPIEMARAPHHLVGVLDPHAPVDAAIYVQLADNAVRDVRHRGRIPIVCGGTFLWIRSLVRGLAEAPSASPSLRAQLDAQREQLGGEAMHARLREVDACTADRLHPNDWIRVQRALEVFLLSGRRLSDLHTEHGMRGPRYRARFVGIRWEPRQLEERIRARASAWLATGWIEEVQHLLALGYRNTRPMLSVGYRQIVEHLEGDEGREGREGQHARDGLGLGKQDLLESIVRATKVFARRQRTWLRDEPVHWLDQPDRVFAAL